MHRSDTGKGERIDEIVDSALRIIRPVIKPENGTGITNMDSARLSLKIDIEQLITEAYKKGYIDGGLA